MTVYKLPFENLIMDLSWDALQVVENKEQAYESVVNLRKLLKPL